MPRKPDTPCSDCGKMLWTGTTSLTNPTCRDCRRMRLGLDGSADTAARTAARKKALHRERQAKKSDVPCSHCGKWLTEYQAKQGQRYCSHPCSLLSKSRTADCKHCGQQFKATRDRATYCGNKCRQRALATNGILRDEQTCKWASHLTYSNCQICGELICYKAAKLYCSSACRVRASGLAAYQRHAERFMQAAHKRRAALKKATIEDVVFSKIYERDKWTCHICGKKVRKAPRFARDPEMASPDHLVPLSQGGAHSYANIKCSHLGCNLKKHTKATGEQLMLIGTC